MSLLCAMGLPLLCVQVMGLSVLYAHTIRHTCVFCSTGQLSWSYSTLLQQAFYRPYAVTVAKPTASKHWITTDTNERAQCKVCWYELLKLHKHTHHLNGHCPGKPGSVCCSLDLQSPVILILSNEHPHDSFYEPDQTTNNVKAVKTEQLKLVLAIHTPNHTFQRTMNGNTLKHYSQRC